MEELRSTEVLEREILEDARKKAARLLKTADDTLAQQKRNWEKKLADDLEAIRKTYMERMKKNTDDIFARLPLDKRRLRLKTHEGFLTAAMNDFLTGLDRERIFSVLERELSRRLEAVKPDALQASAPAVVQYSGITPSEARALLAKSPVSLEWQFQELPTPHSLLPTPYIVVETDSYRLTASIESAAADLLKENREELAAALLGPEALYD